MRAARLLFAILSLTAVSEATVIYTYTDTYLDGETPSYLSPTVLQTIGFSLTTQSYLTTATWFYQNQIASCQPYYGMACNQVLLTPYPNGVGVELIFDGATTNDSGFSGASLTQDGTYSNGQGATLTVADPPAAPEPATWLLSALGVGLLGCTRRWVRRSACTNSASEKPSRSR